MDLGYPVSYEVVEPGTPVYSSDEHEIGKVVRVLAVEAEDVFDGIVIAGADRHRFADADDIASIYERGVVLKLDRQSAEQLPAPTANPAVMRDDPADTGQRSLGQKLRLTWERIKGNY